MAGLLPGDSQPPAPGLLAGGPHPLVHNLPLLQQPPPHQCLSRRDPPPLAYLLSRNGDPRSRLLVPLYCTFPSSQGIEMAAPPSGSGLSGRGFSLDHRRCHEPTLAWGDRGRPRTGLQPPGWNPLPLLCRLHPHHPSLCPGQPDLWLGSCAWRASHQPPIGHALGRYLARIGRGRLPNNFHLAEPPYPHPAWRVQSRGWRLSPGLRCSQIRRPDRRASHAAGFPLLPPQHRRSHHLLPHLHLRPLPPLPPPLRCHHLGDRLSHHLPLPL